MDDQTTVTLDQISIEEGIPSYSYYFNYLAYALLAVLILGISSIMMVFNNQDIKRRNSCAPVSYTHLDVYKRQLLGCFLPAYPSKQNEPHC